jgi:hypothetical protein
VCAIGQSWGFGRYGPPAHAPCAGAGMGHLAPDFDCEVLDVRHPNCCTPPIAKARWMGHPPPTLGLLYPTHRKGAIGWATRGMGRPPCPKCEGMNGAPGHPIYCTPPIAKARWMGHPPPARATHYSAKIVRYLSVRFS